VRHLASLQACRGRTPRYERGSRSAPRPRSRAANLRRYLATRAGTATMVARILEDITGSAPRLAQVFSNLQQAATMPLDRPADLLSSRSAHIPPLCDGISARQSLTSWNPQGNASFVGTLTTIHEGFVAEDQ